MRIIEGLKQLKLIIKKINTKQGQLKTYAAQSNLERLPFGTAEEQKKQVQSLIQSIKDLFEDYLKLKTRIDRTNLTTQVTIKGESRSIAEWILIRRNHKLMHQTYVALDAGVKDAEMNLRYDERRKNSGDKAPEVEKFFDEKEKNAKLEYWSIIDDEIDARLEVMNAITELIDEPDGKTPKAEGAN